MSNLNRNLGLARVNKNDEFYTRLEDIENELRHYRHHFKDKVVYCNCDDPRVSNFFHYFSYNFDFLGLKKLITTCYQSQEMDLFSQHDSERAIKLEYTGEKDGGNVPKPESIGIEYLKEDGDFRSEECIEFLKQADIVVTNPPFSLFREYVAQLIEFDKKFLILGNANAITYKEIFPLIKENKIWIGHASMNSDMFFNVSDEYAEELVKTKKEGSGYRIINGKVKARAKVAWYTNLNHRRRYEELILYKRYNPDDYPEYDNYKAIEVSRIVDIPEDYDGIMGVPVTFIDKYNPDQFEIIWTTDRGGDGYLEDLKKPYDRYDAPVINGQGKYKRIFIKNKKVRR